MGPFEPSDTELWSQALAHDGAAFGRLFQRHATSVYNHCFRRTADWSLAEDLTSIAFLETWRRRGEINLQGGSLLPWLLGVANNAVRNAERSRRRYHRLLDKLPRSAEGPQWDDEVAARVDDERSMRALLDQVQELRPDEQDALALCDWSGLSMAEASKVLGVPVGTVKSRLSRARDHLRNSTGRHPQSERVQAEPEVTHDGT